MQPTSALRKGETTTKEGGSNRATDERSSLGVGQTINVDEAELSIRRAFAALLPPVQIADLSSNGSRDFNRRYPRLVLHENGDDEIAKQPSRMLATCFPRILIAASVHTVVRAYKRWL
ncbi:MAG: hypothetical protein M1817_000682 [Caeruleum heppii]|nr:MAG: hypothetical protein M1817_000682 [Caeruleum heppii]